MEKTEENPNFNLTQYKTDSGKSGSNPAAAASVLDERSPASHDDSQSEAEYHIPPCTCTVQHTCPGRIINFVQDDVVIKQVPYNKEMVNKQAMEYVGHDVTLWLPCCGFCSWQECFDRLDRTKGSTVIVFPFAQKQRQRTLTQIKFDQVPEFQ